MKKTKFIWISHTHLVNEITSVLHNSLNPRPEPLAGADDDLPVHVGHYLWDLVPDGVQGVMRVFNFIDLFPNFAPHEFFSRITTRWAGRTDFLRQVVFQVGLQPAWVILAVWAREALRHSCRNFVMSTYFVVKDCLFKLRHNRDGQLSNECWK